MTIRLKRIHDIIVVLKVVDPIFSVSLGFLFVFLNLIFRFRKNDIVRDIKTPCRETIKTHLFKSYEYMKQYGGRLHDRVP